MEKTRNNIQETNYIRPGMNYPRKIRAVLSIKRKAQRSQRTRVPGKSLLNKQTK